MTKQQIEEENSRLREQVGRLHKRAVERSLCIVSLEDRVRVAEAAAGAAAIEAEEIVESTLGPLAAHVRTLCDLIDGSRGERIETRDALAHLENNGL